MKNFDTKNIKNIKVSAYTHNDEIYNFNFGTDLSVANKRKFVQSVVGLVVNDEEKEYNSVIRDLVFDFYTIELFTDIDTTKLATSKTFLEDVELFLEETNIVEIVKANAVPFLFDELNTAIDDSITYITGVHFNSLSKAITSLLNTLEKKIDGFDLDSMMKMAQKFTNMTGELTPDSIMNAYINSDIFKKNVKEIEESKKQRVEIAENLDKVIKKVNEENRTEKKSKSTKSKVGTKSKIEKNENNKMEEQIEKAEIAVETKE